MTKTARSEELHNRTPKPPQLLALCARCWLDWRLTGDPKPLHKANHRLITNTDFSLELQFCQAFFAVELALFDNAAEIMERLGGFKSYYKANSPPLYGAYLFLQALCGHRMGKERAAARHCRALADFSQKAAESHAYPLMLGWLRLEGVEGGDRTAWEYFSQSFALGGRSAFLFERVYRCLSAGGGVSLSADRGGKLMLAFFHWSISQGADASAILDAYMGAVLAAAGNSPETLEAFYAAYPDERILSGICLKYISRGDCSEAAYRFYHDAEARQLPVPGLQKMLMRSAFALGLEDVGRYTMEQFLNAGFGGPDGRLRAFVYHVMLTSKKMRDFVPANAEDILRFAAYALENGLTGRYYNSVYKFFIENENEYTPAYAEKAAEILLGDIFTYSVAVSGPGVKHIWVIEKERRGMSPYEVKDGAALVKAVSERFAYVCFSGGAKHIIDEGAKITKLVENADIGLYSRFYARGIRTPEILIALARHFLACDEISGEEAGVLKAAAEAKGLSTAFKMQLSARLGNYFYESGDIAQALAHYRDVDENYLNDKYIERMLTVFINTGEYEKAAWLVAKKAHCISDKALFPALKKIALAEPGCGEHIATAAYELLLDSWYDKALIDTVTKHYKGAQADWEELNKVLTELSSNDASLDEMILRNAIWIRRPDAEAQKVFARRSRSLPDDELAGMFAYYLAFEMLVNGFKPEYDTIGVLEAIFRKWRDSTLGYALSNMYILHGITTLHSDEVISRALGFMERDGFILPIFKQSQDKKIRTPYIEKYQAFTYKGLPDKEVRFYYRAEGEAEYRTRHMDYLKFGIYYATVPQFYGEKLMYYFSEEMPTGSITTKESEIDSTHVYLDDYEEDQYYVINNALIYEHMFKFEKVEAIITDSLREVRGVRAKPL